MQTWHEAIGSEKFEPYFQHIIETVKKERGMGRIIYPPAEDVFNAFKATEFGNVKVVILGQDPYHGAGQAHGLAFSVREGVAVPPSLVNIYKELADDIEGFRIPQHGYLQHWAEQGVLLLNTVLTVRAGQAHSHATLGWERFTDEVVNQINRRLHALGQPRAEKRRVYRPQPPSRPQRAAPLAAVSLSRFFRLQTLFPSQCLFAGKRDNADRLAGIKQVV